MNKSMKRALAKTHAQPHKCPNCGAMSDSWPVSCSWGETLSFKNKYGEKNMLRHCKFTYPCGCVQTLDNLTNECVLGGK